MPIPVQDMNALTPRSFNHTGGTWTPRRSGETGPQFIHVPLVNDPQPTQESLVARLAEIERMLHPATRRPQVMTQQQMMNQGPNPSAPMPSIPLPPPPAAYGPGPMQYHQQQQQQHHTAANIISPPLAVQNNPGWNPAPQPLQNTVFFNPQQPHQGPQPHRPYTAPTLLPPPPPYQDDIFKDFSQCNPQEYFVLEGRLYQRINFHAKIRLGYGKAISVLQKQLEESQDYQRIIRPYQIDQPTNLPELSPLIPNSEARLFADTVRALVDIIGLQKSVHILETAKVGDVPGIKYEIQRVPIPSRNTPPIPLEPEFITIEQPKPSEIGPFARSRSDSFNSVATTAVSADTWGSSIPMNMDISPPAPPSSLSGDEFPSPLPAEDMLPPPMSAPPAPHRSILRRTQSGSSLNGKRVTIQADHAGCRCNSRFCTGNQSTSPFEHGGQHVMSPGPMSPTVKLEENNVSPMELQLGDEFQARMHRRTHDDKPSTPEEVILQQMAAAQM
jgi:hypothetical protein